MCAGAMARWHRFQMIECIKRCNNGYENMFFCSSPYTELQQNSNLIAMMVWFVEYQSREICEISKVQFGLKTPYPTAFAKPSSAVTTRDEVLRGFMIEGS